MHFNRCVWYHWLLIVLNASGGTVNSLTPRITTGRKPACGSPPSTLLRLSSQKNADDDGVAGSDDSEHGATADGGIDFNDFVGKVSNISQPTKSDLYGDDELAGLLDLHQQLQSAMAPAPPQEKTPQTIESPNDLFSGGLHDLILQTIDEIEEEEEEDTPPQQQRDESESWISEDTRDKLSKLDIIAVASDVDGTIIGFDQTIHPRTIEAIKAAQESSKLTWIFPATGKTRWGARNSLGPELSSLTEGPGVYCQGLYCLGTSGEVVFEKKLTSTAVEAAEKLVAGMETGVVAYDGDSLYSTDASRIEVVELHEKWGEPASREIPTLSGHASGIHKILLMDDNVEKLKSDVRPKLEALAMEYGCVVTQAVPTMLELLPNGCSKAKGVEMVCEYLGIDPATQLLTIGDAENDVEMLEASAIGVAVGNACSAAKAASDIILPLECSEGGVAMALNDVLGL